MMATPRASVRCDPCGIEGHGLTPLLVEMFSREHPEAPHENAPCFVLRTPEEMRAFQQQPSAFLRRYQQAAS